MNTDIADLALCKELYTLSEWSDTHHYYLGDEILSRSPRQSDLHPPTLTENDCAPAYNLGYLLRKLPPKTEIVRALDTKYFAIHRIWTAQGVDQIEYISKADTPENAAANLCIELFQQKILIRGKA